LGAISGKVLQSHWKKDKSLCYSEIILALVLKV